jgi:carbon storage regulator
MIIIPRRVGESVVIDDDIILTVVEIQGDTIRVEIEHPPEATVHTQEVFESLRRGELASVRPR